MSYDAAIDDWDEGFLGAALDCIEKLEASRNPTQNPNPPVPCPAINVGGGVGCRGVGGGGDGYEASSVSVEYSPPRELSQRVPEKVESSGIHYASQTMRAPVPKNGGYGVGKNKRDREIERLKNELERASKQLSAKERECKELQNDRDKKDEQLKDAHLHIENKDAEICRLKRTNLTYLPQAKDVQVNGQSEIPELKDRIMIDDGLTSSSGVAIQESCFPNRTAQLKPSSTKGVQTDIVQDGGPSDAKVTLPMEHNLSSKLHAIWGFHGDKIIGRNLISTLFVTCAADFCALFECMSFTSKTNLYSWANRSISDTALHDGTQSPQSVDGAKISRLYEILMKVHHEVAPLQTLIEALFDLCTLENVSAAHKSLCILHAILQHLSCITRLERRNNVLIDQSRSSNFPEGGSIGLEMLENENKILRTNMYLSFETLILIFEKMQKIALSKTEEHIQTEALSIMNLTLMASNPTEREKFGLVHLLECLPQLLQKEIGLCLRKQAVHLLFLVLNCPKMLSMFCDGDRDDTDHAKVANCLITTPTLREGINHILEGLAECLACVGATTQELKLQRDVIVTLAFIASSGKSGFDVLLYSATPQRVNFLELIIRVLASEMDVGKADVTKTQTFCKESISLIREALILLNRLASNPAYSKVTLGVLTSSATASLTIDVADRMSRKSGNNWKHDAIKKLEVQDEIVGLARLFKARVFTFLGESNH